MATKYNHFPKDLQEKYDTLFDGREVRLPFQPGPDDNFKQNVKWAITSIEQADAIYAYIQANGKDNESWAGILTLKAKAKKTDDK